MRRVPNSVMPHRAVLTPYLGDAPDGHLWGEPMPSLRAFWMPANVSAGGTRTLTVTLDGEEYQVSGRVVLDDEPPLRSKLRLDITGDTDYWVAATKLWDHPRAARFTEAQLTLAPLA